MKIISTSFCTLLLSAALATPALAQDHSGHAGHGSSAPTTTAEAADAMMTAGEITRIDARNGKLTIRHEEIKNLDMPPMTMVFALAESAKPATIKAGDKVLFRAEEKEGALIITRIQPAS